MVVFHGSESPADRARQIDTLIHHQAGHFLLIVWPTDLQLLSNVHLVSFILHDSLDEEDQAMNRAWVVRWKRKSQIIGIARIGGHTLSWNIVTNLASRSGIAKMSLLASGESSQSSIQSIIH